MSSSVNHPDIRTLQAWLDSGLGDDVCLDVERHIENCEQCALQIEELENPQLAFAGQLCAIHRGEQQVTSDSDPDSPACGELSEDAVRSIRLHWQDTCAAASLASETIKGGRTTDASERLDFLIKERSVHSSEDSGSDPSDYQLLEVLGEGGMGVVYSARQSSVDRVVAVKMLRKEDEDATRRQLFLQEAMVTADLNHPNIVPVHELGRNEQGALFYSMKQIEGTLWSDVIESNSQEENLDILLRTADAVAFAHSRGIVHRDLKPENVHLGQFGEVRLMDWGLAQATSEYRKPEFAGAQRMGGTPAYMAPEMTKPKQKIGLASDVYLLGAILFSDSYRQAPAHRRNGHGLPVRSCAKRNRSDLRKERFAADCI